MLQTLWVKGNVYIVLFCVILLIFRRVNSGGCICETPGAAASCWGLLWSIFLSNKNTIIQGNFCAKWLIVKRCLLTNLSHAADGVRVDLFLWFRHCTWYRAFLVFTCKLWTNEYVTLCSIYPFYFQCLLHCQSYKFTVCSSSGGPNGYVTMVCM